MIKLFYYNDRNEPLKVITFNSVAEWVNFDINLKPPPTSSYVKLDCSVGYLDGMKLRIQKEN